MKFKKTLLLLPAIMLMTGCGEDANPETKGSRININNPAAAANFAQRVANGVNKSYQDVGTGVEVELKVNVPKVNFEMKQYSCDGGVKEANPYSTTAVSLKDTQFTLRAQLINGGTGFNSLKAYVGIEDFSAKFNFKATYREFEEENQDVNINFSDLDLGVWLDQGVVYADLSSATIPTLAAQIVGQLGLEQQVTQQISGFVTAFNKKLSMPLMDIVALATGDEPADLLPTLNSVYSYIPTQSFQGFDQDTYNTILTGIAGAMTEISSMEGISDLLKFETFGDAGFKLSAQTTAMTVLNMFMTQEMLGTINPTGDVTVSASISSDAKGRLSNVSESMNGAMTINADSFEFDYDKGETVLSTSIGISLEVNESISLSINYGLEDVKSFTKTGFEAFDPSILGLE